MATVIVCAVSCCRYAATTDYEGFALCLLHDHDSTRGILDRLMMPAAYWSAHGQPIVVPCRPLLESDFEPKEGDVSCASDDPRLANVPDAKHRSICDKFSLI